MTSRLYLSSAERAPRLTAAHRAASRIISPAAPVAATPGSRSQIKSRTCCCADSECSTSEPQRRTVLVESVRAAASASLFSVFVGPVELLLLHASSDGGSGAGSGWGGDGNDGSGGGDDWRHGGGDGEGFLEEVFELAAGDDGDEDEEGEDEGSSEEDGSGSESDDAGDQEANEDDEDGLSKDLAGGDFFVEEVVTEQLPQGEGVPTKEELCATMQCQPGFVCNKKDLTADLRNFMNWGIFKDVQARVTDKSKDGKTRVIFTFIEYDFPSPESCTVMPYKGTKLALPASVVARVRTIATEDGRNLDAQKMFQIRKPIEDWYHKQGFTNSYVTHIEGMETGKLKVRVMEGKVNNVNVVPVDADGTPTGKPGNIPSHIIMREVPFRKGQIFNSDFLRKCLKDVFALGLFESMSVNSRPSAKDDTRVDIDLMVKERPVKTADIDLEWQVARTPNGRPGLASWIPGGSLTWENGNFHGSGQQLSATATTANFWNPSDDLGYQLSYKHPDLHGEYDPKRTELNAAVFNTRKLSPVFASGPVKEEVPTMFVDRLGAKIMVSEQYPRNSRGTYGIVVEQVATLEDTGALAPRGTKPLLTTGEYDVNGPPTSLSGTGRDALAFLQAGFTRDTTHYQRGMQLGNRQIAQVEQGFGLGSKHPVFNRHRLSWTLFRPLGSVAEDSRKAPRVLVVHGAYGGCVGDVLPYDLFTLGGPYSVRGYNVGELASARYFLEGAVELRVPVKGRVLYAFAEGASDLGSSRSVQGNPSLYYRRPGKGTSLGLGIKLGAARLECASEGLTKPKILNVRFGERF